ncbi:hypothetical protein C8J56DRAFT_478329 [Mycena floridula]|nr:hypothetical protein C8J56DRAFT_478329 [Mycena floridula]
MQDSVFRLSLLLNLTVSKVHAPTKELSGFSLHGGRRGPKQAGPEKSHPTTISRALCHRSASAIALPPKSGAIPVIASVCDHHSHPNLGARNFPERDGKRAERDLISLRDVE